MLMKPLTLIPSLFLGFVVACGGDETHAPPPSSPAPAVTVDVAPTASAPVTPPARTLTTKRLMPTRPDNLVVDPQFQSLWTEIDATGFGIYEAFVTEGTSEARALAETPVGPGAVVLTLTPGSSDISMVMSVMGGKGPFEASIWVSVAEGAKKPAIEVASQYEDASIVLEADPKSQQTIGGATYVAYRGTSTEDLAGGLYLVATPKDTSPLKFVAPEVVAVDSQKSVRRANSAPLVRPSASAVRSMRTFKAWRERHQTMSPPPAKLQTWIVAPHPSGD
jgi:hypothetical protein